MNIEKTNLEGVLIVTPDVYTDERGMFMETFLAERYREMLGLAPDEYFVQDNLSVSKKGVLRGLHYQAPPMAQGKLVMVTRGRVLDVAVDIRAGSPTYGQHVAVELSADNHRQLWIPRGFAHGLSRSRMTPSLPTSVPTCIHESMNEVSSGMTRPLVLSGER